MGLSLAAALSASLIPVFGNAALAAFTWPNLGTITMTADNAVGQTGAQATLLAPSGIVFTEGASGDFVPGQSLELDISNTSFQFSGSVTAQFLTVSGSCGLSAGTPSVGSQSVTIAVTGTATSSSDRCKLTISGIYIQPTGTTAPVNGNLTATGAAIGLSSNQTIGALSEIAGAAHTVALTWTVPATITGGTAFTSQPSVDVADQFGNKKPWVVTLHVAGGASGSVLTCSPATNQVTVDGTTGHGTWAGCAIDKAGSGYQLYATVDNVTSTPSAGFSVIAGPADHLVFTSYPASNTTTTLSPQPTVAIVDKGGNVVTLQAQTTVTLSLTTAPSGDQFLCGGTLTRTLYSGASAMFSFSSCTVTKSGNHVITATVSGTTITAGPSLAGSIFNVTSGPATKLGFCWGSVASGCSSTVPTTITGGTAFPTQPTIVVQDVNGNTVTSDNTTTVALSIASGTPLGTTAGTLTCTGGLTMRVTAGVASFSGCSIDRAATGYRLTATSYPVYTSATSNAFNVAVGTPSKLVWTAQPNSGVAAQPFAMQPVVSITDAGGNVVPTAGATITLSILNNPAGGTLTCTGGLSKATSLGIATFSGCAINNAGVGYTLAATAANVSPVVSLASITTNPFTVVAPQATITLSTSAMAIIWAKPVTLTVQFGLNGANKPFVLQRSINNLDWAAVPGINVPTSTNASGTATFTSTPDRNYYYRVMFAGTADLSASYSNTVRVVVRQIALLRPIRSGSFYVRTGSSMTFTTTVRPARADLPVKAKVTFTFKLYRAGHLVYSGRRDVYIDAYGKASWTWRFGSPGTWQVRAVANPTPVNANSYWSQIDTVIAY